jgi:hypothetical protein
MDDPTQWDALLLESVMLAFVHRQSLQLIHDPRAHLHQPMPVPEQLPQITIIWTRHPDSRKPIFPQHFQQELGKLMGAAWNSTLIEPTALRSHAGYFPHSP